MWGPCRGVKSEGWLLRRAPSVWTCVSRCVHVWLLGAGWDVFLGRRPRRLAVPRADKGERGAQAALTVQPPVAPTALRIPSALPPPSRALLPVPLSSVSWHWGAGLPMELLQDPSPVAPAQAPWTRDPWSSVPRGWSGQGAGVWVGAAGTGDYIFVFAKEPGAPSSRQGLNHLPLASRLGGKAKQKQRGRDSGQAL